MGRVAQDQKARELAVVVCSHQSSGFDKHSVDPRSSEWEVLPRQLVAPLPHTWNKVLTSLIAQSRIQMTFYGWSPSAPGFSCKMTLALRAAFELK